MNQQDPANSSWLKLRHSIQESRMILAGQRKSPKVVACGRPEVWATEQSTSWSQRVFEGQSNEDPSEQVRWSKNQNMSHGSSRAVHHHHQSSHWAQAICHRSQREQLDGEEETNSSPACSRLTSHSHSNHIIELSNQKMTTRNQRPNYPKLSYSPENTMTKRDRSSRCKLERAEHHHVDEIGSENASNQCKRRTPSQPKTTSFSSSYEAAILLRPPTLLINGGFGSLLVILSIATIFLSTCSQLSIISNFNAGPLIKPSMAYQLTNNLIANNLPPKFITSTLGQASNSEIVVRVKEGSGSIGKLIYTLKGEDPDEDPLTFGVLGSMASDLLRIENVPGNQANVYLRKELDRETTESYQVVITLTDGKLGRGNWITKSMLIIVEDVNDNYPVFGPHRTAISIREDAKVPLIIETIEATDQDEGRFGQVIYKLDELDDAAFGPNGKSISNMFSIENVDGRGVISLINSLDYEQRALYQLRILAVDRAIEHERLTATTSILISVEDCEDQPPMFTFVPSITRIPESLPVGSAVVRVAAIDGDRGINNQIQYKLISVNGQESGPERDLFAMNQATGQVIVAHELNRESGADLWSAQSSSLAGRGDQSAAPSQPGSYVLQVRATEISSFGHSKRADQQQPETVNNDITTELTVILTDVNDETPSFNQAAYYGEILENSAPESLVTFSFGPPGQLFAATTDQQPNPKVVDRDQGTNGTFTLHLEGEHSQLFDIWPREATNEANFMIKVSSFGDSQRLQQALDFERTKMLQFNIVAREKFNTNQDQLRSNSAQMTVYLRDSNDNYPQFESELYRVEIPENAIRGMHICAVKATDADSGFYGSQGVRYTEIRGEKANKFKLDPVTGVITLRTNDHGFDRETITQHHLIVEARDSNGSGNRNTTQLLIVLTDVNDQRPKFLLDQYEAFIYENELDFQNPLQVQAVDNDAQNTANSLISYSIVGGDPQQNFTIDPATGRIRVRSTLVLGPSVSSANRQASSEADIIMEGPGSGLVAQASGLDFERIAQKRDDTRQFNLTIKATDAGLPEPLSDLTHVIILVYDKNDHAPVFTRNVYSKSIREDAKEGSQVLQVLAQDGDHSPTNSKITYRISSGASDKFVIDSDSGLISVANGANLDIDRVTGGQKRTNYLLNVIAFDGSFGPNQKSSSALVNISIIDVNNKAPEFVTLGASRWPQLQTPSANPMTTTASSLISAASSTSGQQQQLMVVYVNEDAPYGLVVTRVVASDLDSSAELRYSINYARSEGRNEDMVLVEPNLIRDLFSIDPVDGIIKVAKQLDRELFDQVKLRLQVEDIAAQTADQVAHTYLLIKITDVNDNRPIFKRPVYKAVINENSISGTSVITLTADDRDLNKTLRYSLDGSPEMMRLVRINPRSGEVTVNDKIDRELYPMINVTVRAEDYGHPHPLTGSAQLLITVRDENDNNPIFINGNSQPQPALDSAESMAAEMNLKNHNMAGAQADTSSVAYRSRSLSHPTNRLGGSNDRSATTELGPDLLVPAHGEDRPLPLLSPVNAAKIREDAPIGYQVAYVRAEDADVGNNGRVTYLIDATSSGGKFRIDRDSGIISVAGPLDRESRKQYSLIIEACDNYDLGYATGESRRAFTQVNIQVTDINDNSPVLTTNLQISSSLGGSEIVGHYPTYDDVMSSPGPYEVPLNDCLFINEFQALNEPILTVTASDADDPNTPNGEMDLTIVNGSPQNSLFRLVAIQPSIGATANQRSSTTERSPINMNNHEDLGFGSDLALEESNRQQHQATLFPPQSAASKFGTAGRLAKRSPTPIGATETPFLGPVMSATMASVRHTLVASSGGFGGPQLAGSAQPDASELQMHLVVSQSLKERVGNYSILVRATDRGQPALSSVKLINICVMDVNNHSPIFTRPPLNHTIRIMENATVGTYVTQVEATDLDHGLNGELHYSLKQTNIQNNNNDWQSFKIDRLTGIITTARLFNRQLKKYYTLRVQAQDFGRPTSLSSDIDINIMIVNSGQYKPEFDGQLQTVQFTENVAPGIEWFTLMATTNQDDDPALINPNPSDTTRIPSAAPCYFIVDSDDSEQIFHLDRYTHRLTNQKAIDRERKANYTLLVQATNSCSQPPPAPIYAASSAARQLQADGAGSISQVHTDGNKFPAKTRSARSTSFDSVQPDESATNNTSSTTLETVDSLGSAKFASSSLVLAAATAAGSSDIDTNNLGSSGASSSFNQMAVDALLASDKSLLKVFIKVKDVNDNAPKFTQRVYTGGITTEADFGTVFMIVQAVDSDADNQIVYSIVKPIKRNLITMPSGSISLPVSANSAIHSSNLSTNLNQNSMAQSGATSTSSESSLPLSYGLQRQRRSPSVVSSDINGVGLVPTNKPSMPLVADESNNLVNDIPMSEGDDLFVINAHTGEISLNFDPQKHMKGYFEFEIMANDTDGLFDSSKVFIYLLRQDQRVKFVLRLTPQELRQRLNKFRSVFGNITGAIVNIDSYKYYENHDGTVDKKKTSLYLHFVNSDDNTIIDVDKVLTLIDNNIEYLDELYKEFHVLSSEAAHLPLSSSALIDPIDQIRTGLLGVSSFLALILILVIALCLNQRTRYERQLKAATVSAFGSSPLDLDPDYHSQTNLPNTNLHSQDPNPIWMNGYSDQDWLQGPKSGQISSLVGGGGGLMGANKTNGVGQMSSNDSANIEDADYLSSENSDLNSLSGVNSVSQLHYNVTTTATPRDSLNSSQGRVSGSGSGSTSTTNERQALCRGATHTDRQQTSQQPSQIGPAQLQIRQQKPTTEPEIMGVLKAPVKVDQQHQSNGGTKKRSQLNEGSSSSSITHSTFGAYKEVTIYTDHQQQPQYAHQYRQQNPNQQQPQKQQGSFTHHQSHHYQHQEQPTSQVNKIASQFNAKHQAQSRHLGQNNIAGNQVFINQQQQGNNSRGQQQQQQQQSHQSILVHANGADVNQGIIKSQVSQQPKQNSTTVSKQHKQHQHQHQQMNPTAQSGGRSFVGNSSQPSDSSTSSSSSCNNQQAQLNYDHNGTVEIFETNLSRLSILNLETTEL